MFTGTLLLTRSLQGARRTFHVLGVSWGAASDGAACLSPERGSGWWFGWFLVWATLAHATGVDQHLLAKVEARYGSAARERVVHWDELIRNHQGRSESEKLALVNDFFNQREFVDDRIHWRREDYWATPVEFISSDGGDCEDFAVAKYFTLRSLGVPKQRLRLTYVKAVKLNQAHMVLTYFPQPDAEPLVLDNLVDEILPASQRRDLIPVYSFNGDGLWLAKERGHGELVGGAERLGRWQDLILRIRNNQVAGSHGVIE